MGITSLLEEGVLQWGLEAWIRPLWGNRAIMALSQINYKGSNFRKLDKLQEIIL